MGTVCLEAFTVDDGGTRLVVLLLADPHLLEGGERSQDGASDPDGVFTLWGGDDLERRERRVKLTWVKTAVLTSDHTVAAES